MQLVNPKIYGLSSRIKLLQDEHGSLFLVVDRKSRIIMKDGERIVKIVKNIRKTGQNSKVSLLTSAPVCSKTREQLLKQGIHITAL